MSHADTAPRETGIRLRAVLITPLVLPAISVGVMIFGDSDPLNWSAARFLWVLTFLGNFYLLSLFGFVIFGLPAIAILSRIGRLRIWTLMIAGMVVGALLGCLQYFFFLETGPAHGNPPPDFDVFDLLVLSGGWGLFALPYAAVYGIVAKIRFW